MPKSPAPTVRVPDRLLARSDQPSVFSLTSSPTFYRVKCPFSASTTALSFTITECVIEFFLFHITDCVKCLSAHQWPFHSLALSASMALSFAISDRIKCPFHVLSVTTSSALSIHSSCSLYQDGTVPPVHGRAHSALPFPARIGWAVPE